MLFFTITVYENYFYCRHILKKTDSALIFDERSCLDFKL